MRKFLLSKAFFDVFNVTSNWANWKLDQHTKVKKEGAITEKDVFWQKMGTILEIEVLHDLNHKKVQVFYSSKQSTRYTANVYRGLQGLYGEIWVRGFQIYGDCMYIRIPCNFEIHTHLISM